MASSGRNDARIMTAVKENDLSGAEQKNATTRPAQDEVDEGGMQHTTSIHMKERSPPSSERGSEDEEDTHHQR